MTIQEAFELLGLKVDGDLAGANNAIRGEIREGQPDKVKKDEEMKEAVPAKELLHTLLSKFSTFQPDLTMSQEQLSIQPKNKYIVALKDAIGTNQSLIQEQVPYVKAIFRHQLTQDENFLIELRGALSSQSEINSPHATILLGIVDEIKKEMQAKVALAKAQQTTALAAREFYDAQKTFHAAMPRKIALEKEIKALSAESSTIPLDKKMQDALQEKFAADMIVRMNYTNFILDYKELHKNPFADGLMVQVHKKDDPKDITVSNPDTYSIESLAAQLEKMHEQISSKSFVDTCQALVHSSTAKAWVMLFVNENVKKDAYSINDDLIKPTQYLMRYMSLLDTMKEKTEKLIRIAKENDKDSSRLEEALKDLSKDQEKIKKVYIDPLQESLNLLSIAKILAYELIKDAGKETESAKKIVMIQAAEKLRTLAAGAKYSDLFGILRTLEKETGVKITRYHGIVLKQSQEYKEEVLRNIKAYIPEIKHQEHQADKDKKSDKVMESFINYMRALETEWEVTSHAHKYAGKTLKEVNDKIKIAKFHRELLEKTRKEKPLPIALVVDISESFRDELVRTDLRDTIGIQLRDIAGEYAFTVSGDLAGQKLNLAQLVKYLKEDKTKIAKQLFELKTPGDRRLGQLVAAQLDHLNEGDIEKLGVYLALRNDKNSKLTTKEQEKLYQEIQNIRDKLSQSSNELAVQQINEIRKAIDDAGDNPQLLEKLAQALDTFEKNLKLIIVDDLPPMESQSTLKKIKEMLAEAKDALPLPPPPSLDEEPPLPPPPDGWLASHPPDEMIPSPPAYPPPLDEKDITLVARIELRQAILEKREVATTIQIKGLSSVADEKLKFAYDLMLPSVTKKIDQDFIQFVENQTQYLKELENKYPSDDACDLMVMSSPPNRKTLLDLKIQADEAYIRSGDRLFYVNVVDEKCIEITPFSAMAQKFDAKMKPTDTAVTLTEEQLKEIAKMTGHTRSTFKEKLTEKRQAIDAEFEERKKYSDAKDITIIDALLVVPPPVENKEIQAENRAGQIKEKRTALAMLELRQCLIAQKMAGRDLLVEDADLDKDKLLSEQTKASYKNLTKEYDEYRRENFDLTQYSKVIGNYRIGKKNNIIEPMDAAEQEKLALKILGEKGYRILHSTEADSKAEKTAASTSARMLYLQYLQSALDAHREKGDPGKLIRMEQLLGKRGKMLYKAAMAEEMADPAFINAVFLKSVENFKGPKWKQKLVLWIAGPSSSGKSYATNGMIDRIAKWVMPKESDGEKVDNYVVTIDGGMQRQVSQIRAITVDTSIELGYRGVKDVDSGLDGKLKGKIEHAASIKDDLSIVIPDTFTKYLKKYTKLNTMSATFAKLFRKNVEERCELVSMADFNTKAIASLPIKSRAAYVRSQDMLFYVDKTKNEYNEVKLSPENLKRFDNAMRPGAVAKKLSKKQLKKITKITQHTRGNEILHIYSRVTCGESTEEERTFELSVGRMGESRAFLKIGKTHYSIIMDGVTIIESKKYDRGRGGINFSLGKEFAKEGKKIYREIQKKFGKTAHDFNVTHDLMFITFDKDKKQWRECTKRDQDNVRMITKRAFKAYQEKNPLLLASEDPYEKLDAWLKNKNGGNKPTLSDPIIEYYENGQLKDYETKNLLDELENLQKATEYFLKGKKLEPEQFTGDKELLSMQQYHTIVSNFILITKESQAKKDKINIWKDYQEEIDSVKKAYKLLIDKRLDERVKEIGNWLNLEESKEPLPLLKEPVDLVTLATYMAYLLSKYLTTDFNKEQKQQLKSIINELQSVPATVADEDQNLYIKECLSKLSKLNRLSIDINRFEKIHLGYAAARKREAIDAIFDRNQIGDRDNTKEKATAKTISYLRKLADEWKLEAIVKGNYTEEQKKYNTARLELLETAILDLQTSDKLGNIRNIFQKLKKRLALLPSEDFYSFHNTAKAVVSLEGILTQYIDQVKVQLDTRTSYDKVIKIMNSEMPSTMPSVDKDIADNMQEYLSALKQEWETAENLQNITEEQKKYNQDRLQALEKAAKALAPDGITLQKTQGILGKLKADITSVKKIPEDSALARQTNQAVSQLEKLQTECAAYRYKVWLKNSLIQSAGEPEIKMRLLDLGHYLAHLIEIDSTLENSSQEAIKKLRDEATYSDSDNETIQKFIYATLPMQFIKNEQFNKLFVEHAQAMRRDLQTKIAKESPKDIINVPDIKKQVAHRMIEYLKSIEAEWVARELTTGASKGSYNEHRRILNHSIKALEKNPSPSLEDIKEELKNLGIALQGTLSQPTGLARAFIFSSRSRPGKKSAELVSHTKEDIAAIVKMNETYITPFIDALNQDKEQKEQIEKTEPRRIFLTGKDSKSMPVKNKLGVEIQGTATILKLFGEEVKQQRSKTEYKAGNPPPTPIDLSGWQAQESAKIAESTANKLLSLDAKVTECRGLPSGMCIEYKLQQDNTTTIRESHQHNHVNISAPREPLNYASMSEEAKLAIDMTIAEAMIRLWVARCGTPVYISDTANEIRMRALIIVCEAHDLDYELPYSSRFNYLFLNNPKLVLQDNIKTLENEIRNGGKTPIKVVDDSAGMQELQTKFNTLKAHYEDLNTTLPAEEKKRYAKEISAIDGLIGDAKKGKYNAKAANDAVMELQKSIAEIERHPVSRSSLRGG